METAMDIVDTTVGMFGVHFDRSSLLNGVDMLREAVQTAKQEVSQKPNHMDGTSQTTNQNPTTIVATEVPLPFGFEDVFNCYPRFFIFTIKKDCVDTASPLLVPRPPYQTEDCPNKPSFYSREQKLAGLAVCLYNWALSMQIADSWNLTNGHDVPKTLRAYEFSFRILRSFQFDTRKRQNVQSSHNMTVLLHAICVNAMHICLGTRDLSCLARWRERLRLLFQQLVKDPSFRHGREISISRAISSTLYKEILILLSLDRPSVASAA